MAKIVVRALPPAQPASSSPPPKDNAAAAQKADEPIAPPATSKEAASLPANHVAASAPPASTKPASTLVQPPAEQHASATADSSPRSSASLLSRDRDAFIYCMTFLQATERVACAAVCHQWKSAAMNPAAWRGWSFTCRTAHQLNLIPSAYRSALRRFVQSGLSLAPVERHQLQLVLSDFTGLEDLDCSLYILGVLLEVQQRLTARPIRRYVDLHMNGTDPKEVDFLRHPRMAGLEVLAVDWEPTVQAVFDTIEVELPRLREIRLSRMSRTLCEMLHRKPLITTLACKSLNADECSLPPSITSLTSSSASPSLSFLEKAIHMRHLVLENLLSSDIFPYLVGLQQLETLRLSVRESLSFSFVDLSNLLQHNRSGLKWHHAALNSPSHIEAVHLCRPHSRTKRTVTISSGQALLAPGPDPPAVDLLTGGWDVLTACMWFDVHGAAHFWERIQRFAPGITELQIEQSSPDTLIRPWWMRPLANCRSLRKLTLTRRDGASFGLETANVLAQLPELREVVSCEGALALSAPVADILATSSSLRRLRLEKHWPFSSTPVVTVYDARRIERHQKRCCAQLMQLRPQITIEYEGKEVTADQLTCEVRRASEAEQAALGNSCCAVM